MHDLTVIDTYLRVETPEATDVLLRPAGALARARAYAVDWVLRLLWLLGSSLMVALLLGGAGSGQWFVGFFLLNLFATLWLYPVLFEVLWNGQTPGKRLFQLQVISDNGARIGWSASLLRNLLRLLDGLPLLYALGMGVMLWHPHGKRIGDILAATLVVYTDDVRPAADWRALQAVAPVAPPVQLTREEQQALVAFAERQHKLPPARRDELARQLAEAVYGPGALRADPVALVLGMARFVTGERGPGEATA